MKIMGRPVRAANKRGGTPGPKAQYLNDSNLNRINKIEQKRTGRQNRAAAEEYRLKAVQSTAKPLSL